MTKKIQHIIGSYDVHDPKRLSKVAKIMKDYGVRVLKSVFEYNLGDDQFEHMKVRVDDVIDHMEDSVRYYFVCDKCIGNVEISGLGDPFIEEDEVVIT